MLWGGKDTSLLECRMYLFLNGRLTFPNRYGISTWDSHRTLYTIVLVCVLHNLARLQHLGNGNEPSVAYLGRIGCPDSVYPAKCFAFHFFTVCEANKEDVPYVNESHR